MHGLDGGGDGAKHITQQGYTISFAEVGEDLGVATTAGRARTTRTTRKRIHTSKLLENRVGGPIEPLRYHRQIPNRDLLVLNHQLMIQNRNLQVLNHQQMSKKVLSF